MFSFYTPNEGEADETSKKFEVHVPAFCVSFVCVHVSTAKSKVDLYVSLFNLLIIFYQQWVREFRKYPTPAVDADNNYFFLCKRSFCLFVEVSRRMFLARSCSDGRFGHTCLHFASYCFSFMLQLATKTCTTSSIQNAPIYVNARRSVSPFPFMVLSFYPYRRLHDLFYVPFSSLCL